MFLRNGIKFDVTSQHIIGDIQYPQGWFWDIAERRKLGIIEVADTLRPDPALFDSTENADGTWTSTPRSPALIEEELLEAVANSRAAMTCSRMQGILALGEARWGVVLEYRATATFGEVTVIDEAGKWDRNSKTIQFFGWMMNLDPTDIDAMFLAAAELTD